eukprot:s3901_g2.t2
MHLLLPMGWGVAESSCFVVYDQLDQIDAEKRLEVSRRGGKAFLWADRLRLGAAVASAASHLRSCLLGSPHLNLKTGQVKLADLGFEGDTVGCGEVRRWERAGLLPAAGAIGCGGGDCSTKDSCDERSRNQFRMSSAQLEDVIHLDGIFSDSEQQNPFFASSTRVFVPYCSSDSWLGRRTEKVHGYYFQGAQILTAVLQELRPLLRQARLVVLGGCSAGGRGAFYNLDRLCAMLPETSTLCRGLLDAAWWLPDAGPLEDGAQRGVELWQAELTPCEGNASSHLCLFGPTWAPHVRTPYLVHEEQFDHFLLGNRGVHRPVFSWSDHAWQTAERLRQAMRKSWEDTQLPGTSLAFSGACTDHCFAESAAYWNVKVNGVSMEQLARQWLSEGGSATPTATRTATSVIETCEIPNCSAGCPFEPLLHEVILLALAALLLLFCLCGALCLCRRRRKAQGSSRPAETAGQWAVIGAVDVDDDEAKES